MTDYSDLKTVAPEDLWQLTPEDYKSIKAFEEELYTDGSAMVFGNPFDHQDIPVEVFQDTLAYRPGVEVTPEMLEVFLTKVQEQAQIFYKADGIILKTIEGTNPLDGSNFLTFLVASKDLVELYFEEVLTWKLANNLASYIMDGWGS